MKIRKGLLFGAIIGIALTFGFSVFAQSTGLFFLSGGTNVRPNVSSWDIYATDDLRFDGNILPDGSNCSNGQILKKTADKDWDCAADDTAAGGGVGSPGAWHTTFGGVTLTPTSTTAGIFVNASSTINSTLRVNGAATTTSLVVGTSNPTTDLSAGDIWAGGRIRVTGGTNALPAFSFNGDTNTGVYSDTADQLDFSTGGTSRLTITASVINSTVQLRGPAGSLTAPTFSFTGDTNTGLYSFAADTLGFVTGGSMRLLMGTASSTLFQAFKIEGSATTTGNFVIGTNILAAPTNTLTVIGSSYLQGKATTTDVHTFGDDSNTATSTVIIGNSEATRSGCIEMEKNGVAHRIYINSAGTGLVVEAGSCR